MNADSNDRRHEPVSSESFQPDVPATDAWVPSQPGSCGGKRSRRTGIEKVPGYKPPKAQRLASQRRQALAESLGVDAESLLDDPVLGIGSLERVLGADDRQPVLNTGDAPWRWICFLEITTRSGPGMIATGWFIGPRTVATAGHVVYDPRTRDWARSIKVTPAATLASGSSGRLAAPFGSAVSTVFRSVAAWVNQQDDQFDYGAIILPDDRLGRAVGQFGYANLTDASLLEPSVPANISGYPSDKRYGSQWFHAREILRVSPRKLYYTIDTHEGQSGSPVWQLVDGQRRAIGVHTGSVGGMNTAVRINNGVQANFDIWVNV